MTGGLSLGNAGWLWPVLALWAAAVALSLLAHRRLPPMLRSTPALALRLGGFTILALALLEPAWSRPRARPGANFFAVLADDSRSLQLPAAGGQPLGAALQRQLASGSEWQRQLGEIYQLRRYLFDDRLERVTDFGGLRFDGTASHLASALRTLGDRFRGAPLAGVLLFTDGNATDVDQTPPDLAGLPPLYPVLPDAGRELVDLAVSRVTASETLFEDAPVSIEAQVETSGLDGAPVAVELRDQRDTLVETQRLTASGDAGATTVRFRVRPPVAAVKVARATSDTIAPHYRVVVRAPAGTAEATAANNARSVVIPRPRGPARILYLGGRPSWEYKFLRRALENDRLLQLVALVRMAPREPKFAFLTRRGETTNPLFRGFGASADDAERFDEPVLLRLGTRDAQELEGGFPKTAEALFEYQALIVDDMEAGFFSAAQQGLVERFVSERGGGFLMLGGVGSFRQGGYERTPIGDLLPVYLDRPAGAMPGASPAGRFTLTREGWLEAWARLRENEPAERERLQAMPAFKVSSRTRGLKPGATVVATLDPGRSGSGKDAFPALVVQRAGDGRAAAITVGDLWRWGLHRSPGEPEDLSKFWRQTLRALVADVPRPVTVTLEPRPSEAGTLLAEVKVRGRDFRPADGARVHLEAIAPDGSRLALQAQPAPNQNGVYQAVYRPQGSGVFRLQASATAPDGQPLGEASAGRALDREADEHRSVRPNLALLESLARQTGGAVIRQSELEGFVRRLRDRPAPVSDLDTRPLWHSWLVLLAALACFAGEWALRRRRGLP